MNNLDSIKKIFIDKIKANNVSDDLFKKVENELDVLAKTNGLEGKNNLEKLYNIWLKNKGNVGTENKINSWTAYCIGLTSKKPNEEEDFLPSRRAFARAGFPDIDTDFEDGRRDEIYEYLIEKYGRENVGNIGTHGLLKFKSCIRRVAKVFDIANTFHQGKKEYISGNEAEVTRLMDNLPKGGILKANDPETGEFVVIKDLDGALKCFKDFKEHLSMYPEVEKNVRQLDEVFANFSIHAAGVVVSDQPLEQIAPLRTARKDLYATQWPNPDLESLGLIKFDILAISTLTVVKRTVKLIKQNYDIDIDIENLPLDDDKTFKLYRDGNLGGVFQCEQKGMQDTMKMLKVSSFDDIMSGLALYRPGPMDSIPEYCAIKNGERKMDFFHPSIEPFVKPYLEKTYSKLVYQEQIMQICNSLAGFSITEGYVIIKAIGKKKKDLMAKYREQFVKGCVKNKVPQNVAEKYWDQFIVPFANYGFNSAHSCCYSFNSYLTAYLKANYPEEFIVSLLNVESERANFDKVVAFEREFSKKMGVKFLPRTINDCSYEYKIERSKDISKGYTHTEIRPSLICKGLGYNVAKHIVEKSPYKDLRDFAQRTETSFVDSKAVQALIEGGFFNGKKGIQNKDKIVEQFTKIKRDMKVNARKGVESVDLFA